VQKILKGNSSLMKACCLRRNKNAELDGRPIVILPNREVIMDSQTFSKDEQEFYTALEQKQRLQFNKYLRAGTVMKLIRLT
jgi:hypothetical protein